MSEGVTSGIEAGTYSDVVVTVKKVAAAAEVVNAATATTVKTGDTASFMIYISIAGMASAVLAGYGIFYSRKKNVGVK